MGMQGGDEEEDEDDSPPASPTAFYNPSKSYISDCQKISDVDIISKNVKQDEYESPPASPPASYDPTNLYISDCRKHSDVSEITKNTKHKLFSFGVDFLLGNSDNNCKVKHIKLEDNLSEHSE